MANYSVFEKNNDNKTESQDGRVKIMKPLILRLGEVEFVIKPGERQPIGRDPTQCEIVIPHQLVSRKHATVEYTVQGQTYVTDHKSKNGTYYNEIQISNREQVIPPGNLMLGPVLIYLEVKDMISESNKRKSYETEVDLGHPEIQ